MKKRLLSTILVLCVMLAQLPMEALAANEPISGVCGMHYNSKLLLSEGDYQCSINTDGTVAITKYQGGGGDVAIPSEIGGKRVTRISNYAFSNCSSLESITIPGSVDTVDRYAFNGCSSLACVTIQEGVKCIRDHAFAYCDSLTSITIPSSIETLVTQSQTQAGYYEHAFAYCSNLTEIKVASGNKWYDSRENCNGIIETKSNTLVVGGKNTKIPNSVTEIGSGAFEGQTGLMSVTIPNSVTVIKEAAFLCCSGLTSVAIPSSVKNIEGGAFSGCSSLTDMTIPDGVTKISYNTFWGCESLTSVIIPESVKQIEEGAFLDCSSLTSLAIPDGVTEITWQTFYGCSSLTSIVIPSSVTDIEEGAFSDCSSLADVYYEGSKSDWKSIDTSIYDNTCLTNATIHYNSKWNFSLFQSPSTKYNNRLALIAADMSEKAEDGENEIRELYESYGLSDCEYFNFGFNESAAFAIGQDTMNINGTDTTVLVITARGSTTWWEFIGDLFKGWEVDFLGTKVWGNVHEFYETIWNGVRDYIYRRPELWTEKHLKILINGHSLGGAAANMLGAMLTNKDGMNDEVPWKRIGKENIYVYTFGTIKVLTEENKDRNISGGYENIHNIYNYYDSFGPNGNWADQNASAINAKFGHTELYYLHEKESGWLMWNRTSNNHLMSNYKKALEEGMVTCATEELEGKYKFGDVNGNGKVNLADAQFALKAALNLTKLSEEQIAAADVDGNGKVDLTDAQMILKAALNLIVL